MNRIGEELQTKGPLGGTMLATGLVTAQDVANGRVRVRLPDHDNLETWWLRVVCRWSQDNKEFWIPDVGEQVEVILDERAEDGVVLGASYSSTDATPGEVSADKHHTTYKDGAIVEYDRASHAAVLRLPAGSTLTVQLGSGVTLVCDAEGLVAGDATTGTRWTSPAVQIVAETGVQVLSPHIELGAAATQQVPLGNLLVAWLASIVAAYNSHKHGDSSPPSPPMIAPTPALLSFNTLTA